MTAHKGLDRATVVPTPHGYALLGSLSVGDLVFGGSGAPVAITEVSDTARDGLCFELAFSTGERTVVGALHPWTTETLADRLLSESAREHRAAPGLHSSTRSTTDILKTLSVHGVSNHSLAPTPGLVLDDATLPVAPYPMGTWLGSDPPEGGRASVLLGVDGSGNIPVRYLRSSTRQRRELLSGVIDVAGTVDACGQVTVSIEDVGLARDVHELICSLGHPARIGPRTGRAPARLAGRRWAVSFAPGARVFGRGPIRHEFRPDAEQRRPVRLISRVRPAAPRPLRAVRTTSADDLLLVGRSFVVVRGC
ncbi:hypothetical protein LK09_00830 [Microbacterium mangrovi]|uniref:DOD-type homing endonuclease domain-containing protein n=1 Tax=Microbacterium mangrovi TaxID=1348253 RepID=A0A0B2A8N3_9MICO|nr:hypothetical protein [Microbacterium mangrovi]KHK99908.1 hypothetical protein LK09_00830 [Microbacterium mangrovi]